MVDSGVLSFADLVKTHLDKDEFLSFYQEGHKEFQYNFNQFLLLVVALAQEMSDQYQIGEGQKVALLTGDGLESFLGLSAILYLGAVAVPLDPQFQPSLLQKICDDAEVKVTLTSEDYMSLAEHLYGAVSIIRHQELRFDPHIKIPAVSSSPSQTPAVIHYHAPQLEAEFKTTAISWENLAQTLDGNARTLNLTPETVLMTCLPLHEISGWSFGILLPLFIGCRMVYQKPFTHLSFWRVARREHVEIIKLNPDIIATLAVDPRNIDTGHVKQIVSTTATRAEVSSHSFRQRFPHLQVLSGSESNQGLMNLKLD